MHFGGGLICPALRCADSRHPQADSTFFQRREFCFTLDGDIFVRYQSFKVRLQSAGAAAAVQKHDSEYTRLTQTQC